MRDLLHSPRQDRGHPPARRRRLGDLDRGQGSAAPLHHRAHWPFRRVRHRRTPASLYAKYAEKCSRRVEAAQSMPPAQESSGSRRCSSGSLPMRVTLTPGRGRRCEVARAADRPPSTPTPGDRARPQGSQRIGRHDGRAPEHRPVHPLPSPRVAFRLGAHPDREVSTTRRTARSATRRKLQDHPNAGLSLCGLEPHTAPGTRSARPGPTGTGQSGLLRAPPRREGDRDRGGSLRFPTGVKGGMIRGNV